MAYSNIYDHIIDEAASTAKAAFRNGRGAVTQVNIYYKAGSISVATEEQTADILRQGYVLAFPEVLTGFTPYSHMRAWLYERCRQVPCLPA